MNPEFRTLPMEVDMLSRQNRDLLQDVTRLDQELRSVSAQKDEATRELERTRNQLVSADLRVTTIEKEKRQLGDNLNETQRESSSAHVETKGLQDAVSRLQEDKKRLAQRIEKLTANERALVLEIERCRVGSKKAKAGHVEEYMKGIEQDRDYWRKEAEMAGRISRLSSPKPKLASRPGSRSSSPVKNGGRGEKFDDNSDLASENERLRQEVQMLRSTQLVPTRDRSPSRIARNAYQGTAGNPDFVEVSQLRRERDDLRNLMNKLEHRVAEIQGNVRVITQERDHLTKLYEDARIEASRLRQEVAASCHNNEQIATDTHSILKRVEAERDETAAELRRVSCEREGILERYKTTVDAATADKLRLEQRLEETCQALRGVTAEKSDQMSRSAGLSQQLQDVEKQLADYLTELDECKKALKEQQTTSAAYRQQSEATQRQLEASERGADQLGHRLHETEEKNHILMDSVSKLELELKTQRDDFLRLRSRASQLDQEKDGLQAIAEDRGQRVAQLEAQLNSREHALAETRATMANTEQQLARTQEAIIAKEREARTMHSQLDGMNAELNAERTRGEALLRENHRQQEDLSSLSRENQALQVELQQTAEEREEWRQRSLASEARGRRTDELLTESERGRAALAEECRSLTENAEATRDRMTNEASTLRSQLGERDAEVRTLRGDCDRLERECSEQRAGLAAHDVEIANLSRSVRELNEQLLSLRREKEELLSDLGSLRDLCTRLETTRDALQRDLSSASIDLDQLKAQLDDLEQENDALQSQVDSEQSNVRNLESILSASRQKEYQAQLDNEDKRNEIALLKERLNVTEDQLNDNQQEVESLSSKNAALESDLGCLHRTLTGERLDKDRVISDLRIASLSPAYRPIPPFM